MSYRDLQCLGLFGSYTLQECKKNHLLPKIVEISFKSQALPSLYD